MQSLAIHPALWQLLRFQAIGKVRKLKASFASPRRQLLSILAVVMAVVWLGNAVAGLLLRDAYEPVAFARWMSWGLLLYFYWHLIHVAYARPEAALEWSPAEQTLLCGGPFSRRELFTYHLMVIFSATLPKASLVAFVFWPDLPMVFAGFCGLLLGLVFLEYLRLILKTLACAMSPRQYLLFRSVIFIVLVAVVGTGLTHALSVIKLNGHNHWEFLAEWGSVISAINQTWIGQLIEAPFHVFADVITAKQISLEFLAKFGGAVFLVAAAAYCSIRLDGRCYRNSQAAELSSATEPISSPDNEQTVSRWPRIARLWGIGPIAWRQLHYAGKHWGTLSVGLGVPAFLACLPMMIPSEGTAMFLTVLASVVFYSFVLLPAALKLDFRRDFDRLAILKTLPIKPLAVVIGQLATPVLLTWAFQISLLTFAAIVCGVSWQMAVGSILFLLPVSIFFTAAG